MNEEITERHRWGDPVSVVEGTPSGCQETERVCSLCGMVKITVHPPTMELPFKAWRTPAGVRMYCESRPPCRPPEVAPA